MPDLLSQTRDFIHRHALIGPAERVLVACSGGPDSMVLAYVLHRLGYAIGLAHCNFGLRPEADEEEELVEGWATLQGIPVFTRRFRTYQESRQDESLQMTARRLRYAFFQEILDGHHFRRLATAHHRDDQTETLLMSLLRARDLRPLQGIPLRNGHIVRPLLFAEKATLLAFARENAVPFAIDASNQSNVYLRNQVRNELIPLLERLNPSLAGRLQEVYEEQNVQFDFMKTAFGRTEEQFLIVKGSRYTLDLTAFRKQWPARYLPLYLAILLDRLGSKGLEAREALRSLDAEVGARFRAGAWELLRDREIILIRKVPGNGGEWEDMEVGENLGGSAWFRAGKKELRFTREERKQGGFPAFEEGTYWMDAEKVRFPICLRHWQQGDRMQPLGMKGRKKLSDIFIDERVPLFDKETALVFEDGNGIILLDGFRIAEGVKLDEQTREVLRVEIRGHSQTV